MNARSIPDLSLAGAGDASVCGHGDLPPFHDQAVKGWGTERGAFKLELLVGGRPVERGDCRIAETKIDSQLPAVMRKVAEYRVCDHDVPWLLRDGVSSH